MESPRAIDAALTQQTDEFLASSWRSALQKTPTYASRRLISPAKIFPSTQQKRPISLKIRGILAVPKEPHPDRVEIYRNGAWVTVVSDPLTNPGGQFDFDSSPPTILRAGRSPKLLPNHEIWYSNFSDLRDCNAQCNNNFAPPSSNGKSTYGDRLHVAHLTIPASSAGVATFVDVGVLHSSIRCMPSNYDAGRYTAVATTGGTPRLLYSSSNDLGYGGGGYCQTDFAGYQNYRGMYIVATAFQSDGYHTVTPCRVFDSRSGSPLSSGVERTINVGGACNIPASAKAIAFNVTVVSPSGSGDLAMYPATGQPTGTSVISFATNQTRASNAVIALEDGKLAARPAIPGSGTTHVVIDVVGFFYEN